MKKILLVDDDEDVVELLRQILSEKGYEILSAHTNAAEVKKTVLAAKPDLILLDVLMPGVAGGGLCSELKKDQFTADIPVIMMSGIRDLERIAHDAQADDYIKKPFDINEIYQKVENLL